MDDRDEPYEAKGTYPARLAGKEMRRDFWVGLIALGLVIYGFVALVSDAIALIDWLVQ